MDFKLAAILICSLLLIFLMFKEISRKDKSHLIWRILASIFSVISFFFLLIPLQYHTLVKQNLNEINLLTGGIEIDTASKIPGNKYTLAGNSYPELKNTKTIQIPDLAYFLKTHPEVNKINIYGYGLSSTELKNIKGCKVEFHPSNKINGIISANWPSKLKVTEKFLIQGIYKNTGKSDIKLLLKGLGKTIDSITVKPNAETSFSFKNQPTQIGKAVFNLIAFNGKNTISSEPVPFTVNEQPEMKVLILASFPDFEYKFLKKWLFDNHYPLAYRSKISKDKYTTDFLNLNNLNLNSVNASALKQFDVLIIDEDELSALSVGEKTAIQTAINNGLGVIIRIANSKSSIFLSDRFPRYESPIQKDKGLVPVEKREGVKLSKLPIAQSIFLNPSENNQAVITETNGKLLVASKINGLGKLTASTLASSYNWLLSGKELDYATYWSALLTKTGRTKTENLAFKTLPDFPIVEQKTKIIIDLTEGGKTPSIKINNLQLPPIQNMELPFEWNVTDWPKTKGWNTLKINQATEELYIYSTQDWLSLRNHQKTQQTIEFLQNIKNQDTNNTISEQTTQNEVSKWWFFASFILCAGFLWVESRILKNI
ncbi:hypothetical protein [Pedobacter aquatilis]|uniref:hypothetical protein n=1 Tax=Pedobacter aquatilis TaxID=351343 RepID=UPI002931D37F|nr:hypothetical protein [Pedobacter aquatilis]